MTGHLKPRRRCLWCYQPLSSAQMRQEDQRYCSRACYEAHTFQVPRTLEAAKQNRQAYRERLGAATVIPTLARLRASAQLDRPDPLYDPDRCPECGTLSPCDCRSMVRP